eukprot:3315890-Pyramimonas_sp.AAC.1
MFGRERQGGNSWAVTRRARTPARGAEEVFAFLLDIIIELRVRARQARDFVQAARQVLNQSGWRVTPVVPERGSRGPAAWGASGALRRGSVQTGVSQGAGSCRILRRPPLADPG